MLCSPLPYPFVIATSPVQFGEQADHLRKWSRSEV